MKTAIVTGANGFIGSYLVHSLLRRQWRVCALGRAANDARWPERLDAALTSANLTGASLDRSRLCACEADLSQPDLALLELPGFLPDSGAVLVHLAGDTRFFAADPVMQRRVNVDGALNSIRALRPFLSRVVHVSTAYIAGDREGTILETETDVGQSFHNNYERTKLQAEVAVRTACAELALPVAIARPSIIVNDTVNGRSSAFTHLNVLVEIANRIQEFYGISDGEVVNPEMRLPFDASACPNIAPVDPIAEALATIAESAGAAGKTYHLCHPAPHANADVFGLVQEAFGIRDRIRLSFVSELQKPLTKTEDMIVRSLKVYLPYLNRRAVFDLANTRALIPDYDSPFGPPTVDYLQKVIAFERSIRLHRKT